MDIAYDLYLRYKSVSVYCATAKAISPLAELLVAESAAQRLSLAAEVFRAVAESGCDTTGEWIKKSVLADDNVFSRAAARGERISDRLKAQVKIELLTFKQLSLIKPTELETAEISPYFPEFGFGGFSVAPDALARYYAERGAGVFGTADCFTYRGGVLCAAENSAVRLSDLMGYAEEKSEIVRNTQNFADGLPAFHTLLYGDCGTGKSATVRAVANEFRGRLKMIELARPDTAGVLSLIARLSGLKQKFIIFIDDLTLDGDCKADVERALDLPHGNSLIYCTADRRRAPCDRPESGEKQAELALFDRFGLVVTYVNPDKAGFVGILKQILRSRGIKWRDEYASVAELAAPKKGGSSPRAAVQIADIIERTYAEKRCG